MVVRDLWINNEQCDIGLTLILIDQPEAKIVSESKFSKINRILKNWWLCSWSIWRICGYVLETFTWSDEVGKYRKIWLFRR